ncbi:Hypothetical predicted protein [Mytilus galloprovincialis]|uniref:Uncharacterized protein n=1 Tax=Mytilus galloprovincialis TaxID=29158 RepID=A0A8B6H5L7_MYTGA|nr:Hypothetical predicted protein [Mytilus galloprovincialis]
MNSDSEHVDEPRDVESSASGAGTAIINTGSSKTKKKRRSRYDILEEKMNTDGVFGSDFEKFLKTCKEKNKALDDLLPDISVKKSYLGNRKTVSSSEASGSKKPYVLKYKTESSDRSGYANKQKI